MDGTDRPIAGYLLYSDRGQETGIERLPVSDEDIIPSNRSVPCRR